MYRWDNKSDKTAEKCFFAEKLKSEYPILKDDEQAGKLLCVICYQTRESSQQPTKGPCLNLLCLVFILTTYILKIFSNIILPSTPWSPE
jgi:hypothetical protein